MGEERERRRRGEGRTDAEQRERDGTSSPGAGSGDDHLAQSQVEKVPPAPEPALSPGSSWRATWGPPMPACWGSARCWWGAAGWPLSSASSSC